jgi:hypothetical protein
MNKLIAEILVLGLITGHRKELIMPYTVYGKQSIGLLVVITMSGFIQIMNRIASHPFKKQRAKR